MATITPTGDEPATGPIGADLDVSSPELPPLIPAAQRDSAVRGGAAYRAPDASYVGWRPNADLEAQLPGYLQQTGLTRGEMLKRLQDTAAAKQAVAGSDMLLTKIRAAAARSRSASSLIDAAKALSARTIVAQLDDPVGADVGGTYGNGLHLITIDVENAQTPRQASTIWAHESVHAIVRANGFYERLEQRGVSRKIASFADEALAFAAQSQVERELGLKPRRGTQPTMKAWLDSALSNELYLKRYGLDPASVTPAMRASMLEEMTRMRTILQPHVALPPMVAARPSTAPAAAPRPSGPSGAPKTPVVPARTIASPAPAAPTQPEQPVRTLQTRLAEMTRRMNAASDFDTKNRIFHEYFDRAAEASKEIYFGTFMDNLPHADKERVLAFLRSVA